MPAGKIPLGNGSGRFVISPTKQAFGTLQLLSGSHVDHMSIQASEKLGREGMVEWNVQNFPGIPIFQNIGTAPQGTPKIPK